MQFEKAFIPYGAYWTTPFCKWQGSLSHLHALRFSATVVSDALASRGISPERLDALFLGTTIPQQSVFYRSPWLAGLIGAPCITGPCFSQACATSGRVIASAAQEIELGAHSAILAVLCDRTSNSPHIYYPNPHGPGGIGDTEDWVWDNFNTDPLAGTSMLQTAENVATEAGIDRAAQDEVALMRFEQYQEALKDDAAFHKRFMVTPLEIKDRSGRKTLTTLHSDEGVFTTSVEGLTRLKPVMTGGTVTFGTQTYPADGNAGLIVADQAQAEEMSSNREIVIRIASFGQGRAERGYMAMATVPAARQALGRAGLSIEDVAVIKTHNPFAVNDVYFAREMGIVASAMNRYGSSLVWGHPQAPTGARLVIEMIEELAVVGGGYGLFVGCAAGDTALAMIIRVG